MKLHEDVAPCNLNIPDIVPTLELFHQNNNNPDFVTTSMLDVIGRNAKTILVADNVLVFGRNPEWNREIAVDVKGALVADGRNVRILNVAQFFSMSTPERSGHDILHIITCNDIHSSPEKLAALKSQTGTQILFKIAGLDWKRGSFGINLSKSAKLATEALGIKEDNAVALGLLASLGAKEFCVSSDRSFTKRTL